jgi:hypothetical protein
VRSSVRSGKLVLAAVGALSLLFPFTSEPLAAAGLTPGGMAQGTLLPGASRDGARLAVAAHFRRATSYYCYPRNYWWFYRPYTTADQGYQRCMPYFHYSGPVMPGRADGVMK